MRDVVNKRQGFTLVEIIVVMSILAILLSVGLFYGSAARKRVKIDKAKNDMRSYGTNIMNYHNKHDMDFPISKRWPAELISACSGGYIVPTDLTNEGLSIGSGCVPYFYRPVYSGSDYVITLMWIGLDGKINISNPGNSVNRDNYFLIVDTNLDKTAAVNILRGKGWSWDTANTMYMQ